MDHENYALEHVLSYQRRVAATEESFMRRGEKPPLGILDDWWGRTEVQMRAELHAHILCWFERRKERDDFKPVPVIERTAPGIEPRQRPLNQKVEPLKEFQHDTVYQQAFVGPIIAEMVRPDVRGTNWGGYDVEKLRIAGLARAIQMRLPYLHHSSSLYCLRSRSTYRLFSRSKFATRHLHDVCTNFE